MAEWPNASVLKTEVGRPTGGSNPSSSVSFSQSHTCNQMTKNTLCLIYTTFPSEEKAISLIEEALNKKLAVCANVISSGKSIYIWNNTIQTDNECYVILKTDFDKKEELLAFLEKNHSYETPAILFLEAECTKKFSEYLKRSSSNNLEPDMIY